MEVILSGMARCDRSGERQLWVSSLRFFLQPSFSDVHLDKTLRFLAGTIIRDHRMLGLVDLVEMIGVRYGGWKMDCTFFMFMYSRGPNLLSGW